MSKNETPLTLAYWKKVKGTLIEEYPIVKKSNQCSPRWIDGLIIKNGDFKRLRSHSDNDINTNIIKLTDHGEGSMSREEFKTIYKYS